MTRLGKTLAVLAVCVSAGLSAGTADPHARPPAAPRAQARVAASSSTLGLSLQQLAGQRVIYSYRGLTPPQRLLAKIEAGEAAGVIFYGENISSDAQIARVISELQHAAAKSPVRSPLLMMTDQEGGLVRRLPGEPLLSEKQIGASANPASAAQQAGRGAGLNLKGVGMNVNLAPVLDVYRAPGDFIDRYQRSYSMNPHTVAQLGADFISAQQRTGVAATAKHFPGLGAASAAQDTNDVPVTLRVPLESLRTIDELPYRSAISAGVRLVMVSWATYPALDPHRPAGLSSTIVQGELRQRLKFKGVTVTDALEAGGLRAFGTIPNRAVLAAGAGMDLLLCSGQNVAEGANAADALASALRTGRLSTASFVSSVKRILSLRAGLPA